jgi:antitoxin HigA-1
MKRSRDIRGQDLLPIPTVGEILLEEYLKPLKLSQRALAHAIRVPRRHINEIVLRKRRVTVELDLRLTRHFRLSEGMFLRLQAAIDRRVREREFANKLDLA